MKPEWLETYGPGCDQRLQSLLCLGAGRAPRDHARVGLQQRRNLHCSGHDTLHWLHKCSTSRPGAGHSSDGHGREAAAARSIRSCARQCCLAGKRCVHPVPEKERKRSPDAEEKEHKGCRLEPSRSAVLIPLQLPRIPHAHAPGLKLQLALVAVPAPVLVAGAALVPVRAHSHHVRPALPRRHTRHGRRLQRPPGLAAVSHDH